MPSFTQLYLLLSAPWSLFQGVSLAPESAQTNTAFETIKAQNNDGFNQSMLAECAKPQVPDQRTGAYLAPWHLARIAQPDMIDQTKFNRMHNYDWSFPRNEEWGKNVIAYVVDSGVLPTHVQFTPDQVAEGASIPAFTHTGSGNVPFGDHGTGVAAMIAGRTTGVAPMTKIFPIKIGEGGRNEIPETSEHVAQGINLAIKDWVPRYEANKALKAVINISWVIRNNENAAKAIHDAVAAGMHVIIAGGNDDAKYVNECHGEIKGPLERVSQQGQITAAYTWFSDEYGGNSGPCIDVEAPSTSVLTAAADCNTCCVLQSSSSFSAPIVAGMVAALLSESARAISPAEMKALIKTRYSIEGKIIGVPPKTANRLLQSPLQLNGPPQ
ncbi:peptidase S8/S53 domain-containing protein [Mycena leptocephala]|nr:peptidase S8/S53 domain-containing protein [Mycena leptocephala]